MSGACWWCGAKSTNSCACSAALCGQHAQFVIDESNIAITRSARPLCPAHAPKRQPRPFSLSRALAEQEWSLELEAVRAC